MVPDTTPTAGPVVPDALGPAALEALLVAGYRPEPDTEPGTEPGTEPHDGRPAVSGRHAILGVGGARFDLTVVDLPDHAARERAVQRLTRWNEVDDPALERLADLVDLGPSTLGLLTPRSAGLTLDGFCSVEGNLSAGRASTVLVVLGRVLARLHHAGEAYGPIAPTRVLVDDGRPVLTLPLPEAGGVLPPSASEDAYHLASVVDGLLVRPHAAGTSAGDRHVVRALGRLLVGALGDAVDRPGVGTLASSSHDLAPCQPLLVLPPSRHHDGDASFASLRTRPSPSDPVGRSGRVRQRPGLVMAALAVAAATAVALLVPPMLPSGQARDSGPDAGVVDPVRAGGAVGSVPETPDTAAPDTAAPDTTAPDTTAPETTAPDTAAPDTTAPDTAAPDLALSDSAGPGEPVDRSDPADAAAELTRARFDLVADLAASGEPPDDRAWSDVVVLGSAAHVQAVGVVATLVEQGATLSGLSVTVTAADVIEQDDDVATVAVDYTVSEYAVHTARGARVVAAGTERAVLQLVPAPEGPVTGWRVVSVAESPAVADAP